jgi:DNA adenine methylase
MPIATSPLRYPGGKACLLDPLSSIIRLNKLEFGHYAEPYAGGCGLALALLFGGHVSDIHINDIDRSIWTFWHAILTRTEEFIDLMNSTPITVDEWQRQREIQKEPGDAGEVALAFSTFFLNRTNRSGIIKNAGVIGGQSQKGKYLIDCRFNKDELSRRIRRIKKYKSRIHLYRKDALSFIGYVETRLPATTFLCIDPPYFNKGASLYTSFYQPEDHAEVARRVLDIRCPWIITYDYCNEIRDLYKARRQFAISMNYSAQVKRVGQELLIASKGLRIPDDIKEAQVHRPQYRAAA